MKKGKTKNLIIVVVFAVGLFWVQSSSVAQAVTNLSLTLPTASQSAGSEVVVPLVVSGNSEVYYDASAITILEFEITYNANVFTLASSPDPAQRMPSISPTNLLSGKNVEVNNLADGRTKVVISGGVSPIKNGEVANITFKIKDAASAGSVNFAFANIKATSVTCQDVECVLGNGVTECTNCNLAKNTTLQAQATVASIDGTTSSTGSLTISDNHATYGIADFANLVADWLQNKNASPADLYADGIVNARDLGVMMHYWGT